MRLRSERKVKTQDLKSRHRCLVANVPSHLVLTNVLSEHHAASSVRILSIAVFTSPRIYIFAQRISTKIADYFFLTDFIQFNFCLWNIILEIAFYRCVFAILTEKTSETSVTLITEN